MFMGVEWVRYSQYFRWFWSAVRCDRNKWPRIWQLMYTSELCRRSSFIPNRSIHSFKLFIIFLCISRDKCTVMTTFFLLRSNCQLNGAATVLLVIKSTWLQTSKSIDFHCKKKPHALVECAIGSSIELGPSAYSVNFLFEITFTFRYAHFFLHLQCLYFLCSWQSVCVCKLQKQMNRTVFDKWPSKKKSGQLQCLL